MTELALARLREVAGPVSRETADGLGEFQVMFSNWATHINLVAASTLPNLWERHVLDSAQLALLAPHSKRWLDVGSGGGFPGLILAFLLKERPGGRIMLIESNRKKAGFLQAVVGRFALPAQVLAARIEATYGKTDVAEVVTARAVATLPALLDLTSPWLMAGAIGLFHKGRDYRSEVKESVNRWSFDLIEHQSKVDAESVVLELHNLHPCGQDEATKS